MNVPTLFLLPDNVASINITEFHCTGKPAYQNSTAIQWFQVGYVGKKARLANSNGSQLAG
jgi:hypothetical protein